MIYFRCDLCGNETRCGPCKADPTNEQGQALVLPTKELQKAFPDIKDICHTCRERVTDAQKRLWDGLMLHVHDAGVMKIKVIQAEREDSDTAGAGS